MLTIGAIDASRVRADPRGRARAATNADHGEQTGISSHAVWWIRRSLSDALADARPIRIPPAARRQMAAIERQALHWLRSLGDGRRLAA